MRQQVEETARDAILVEDAALIRMMGLPVAARPAGELKPGSMRFRAAAAAAS